MQKSRVLSLLLILTLFVGCIAVAPKSAAYTAPAFTDTVFHSDKAAGKNGVLVDTSCVNQGYIGVSAKSDKALKVQVSFGQVNYNYNVLGNGNPCFFPLQSGSGSYRFRVLENVSGNRYREIYSVTSNVVLQDDLQPFLHSSTYINFNKDSECVKKAAELTAGAASQLAAVEAIFDYIRKNISYDYEKAKVVQAGYLPTPDETLKTGKGICFDYAALAASMLRSQGIPTKMIFGYVSGTLYHAWNMFYTPETGWVTVGYQVNKNSWNRLDITFSAGGKDISFIADAKNYTDVYCY